MNLCRKMVASQSNSVVAAGGVMKCYGISHLRLPICDHLTIEIRKAQNYFLYSPDLACFNAPFSAWLT